MRRTEILILGLIAIVAMLFAIGLIMVFNTTAAEVLDRSLQRSTHHAVVKQMLYALVGTVVASGIWFLGYRNILRFSAFFLSVITLLLFMVFLPGIGPQINGAHRWLMLGGWSLQPSEFAKIFIPCFFIYHLRGDGSSLHLKGFLKLLGILAIPLGLILIEPDNGTFAIIMATMIMLLFLTRIKRTYWMLPLIVMLGLAVIAASQMPHVSDRLRIYLHPEMDLKGKGHQPHQAKVAAGSGGLWGKGLGESLQKLDYLPEAPSDYIAAIYAEEFGFVGVAFLILLFMLLGFCGFSIAFLTRDLQGFYLISTMTFLICIQAFLNLGVVSNLLPSKGTNLPFISQGGSSLLSNLLAVCIILNVARASRALPHEVQKRDKLE